MAAISEKILWPIVGIFIFGVLAGFYIDDRRRLMEEGTSPNKQASSSEHGGKAADQKQASNEHAGKAAEKKPSSATTKQTASSNSTGATSMDINEYLAQSSSERSAELEANVTHHQGFHGSIDEYLSGSKPKSKNNMQAKTDSGATNNNQDSGATSMSMDEYHAKTSQQSHEQSNNGGAYHGDIDGYLAKYGSGTQTPMKKQSADPFNDNEHMGFHGSYEEYAKKYN